MANQQSPGAEATSYATSRTGGQGLCCTPAVAPGAAPPRPKLGRGRRI